ncbi:hypothetical protein N7456_002246 [Penicillium angulare]|uniref:DRBM domain-containing protein n=1 Tax=Penicillium angulare TaxID=116970 RepID=A0A9W9G826_9EURO|nr:hypothetical protein N7456_002246 [Penicillium angulare]
MNIDITRSQWNDGSMSFANNALENTINSPQLNDGNKLLGKNAPEKMKSWQYLLSDHCRMARLGPPIFNIVSDTRGGRTAWSSTVTIGGQTSSARYWYDGQYINNAKEDAAEIALRRINDNPALRLIERKDILYSQTSPGYTTGHTEAQSDRARKPGASFRRIRPMSGQGLIKFDSDLGRIDQADLKSTSIITLKLTAKCELLQAIGRYRPNSALSALFTLTGSQFDAEALSCGEYLESKFPQVAAKLLSRVQKGLAEYNASWSRKSPSWTNNKEDPVQDCEDDQDGQDGVKISQFNISDVEEPTATLEVRGNCYLVMDVARAFAWLISAIRSPTRGGIQLSSFAYTITEHTHKRALTNSRELGVGISLLPLQNAEDGLCWNRMFKSMVVVHVPLARARNLNLKYLRFGMMEAEITQDPPTPRGLKISLPLLQHLAAVEYPFEDEDGLALPGISTLLVATNRFRHKVSSATLCIQWHFIETNDEDPLEHYISQPPISWEHGPPTFEESASEKVRHFVGWCEKADIRLGKEVPPLDICHSRLERAGSRPKLKSFNLGASGGQYLTLNSGMTYEFQEDTVKRGTRASALPEVIEKANKAPVILYDAIEKRGWLVPKLLVLLAMIPIYLRDFGYEGLPPLAGKSFPETKNIILRHTTQGFSPVGLLDKETSEKNSIFFLDLFLELYHEITTAQASAFLTRSKLQRYCGRNSIFGFDFLEMARKGNEVDQYGIYKTALDEHHGGWIKLIDSRIIPGVIFCSGLGDIIQCDSNQLQHCNHCSTIPPGLSYLAADTSCLATIHEKRDKPGWEYVGKNSAAAFRNCNRCDSFNHRLHAIRPSKISDQVIATIRKFPRGAIVIGDATKPNISHRYQRSSISYLSAIQVPNVSSRNGVKNETDVPSSVIG